MTDETKQPTQTFKVQRLYIKESNCKVPLAPNLFVSPNFAKEPWQPNVSVEIHLKNQALPDSQHEVVVHGTVTAKMKDGVTAFSIDIQQAGIFALEGFSDTEIQQILQMHCPTLLYPYLCRAIADASVQAGFPPVVLTPMNFAQIAQQQKEGGEIATSVPETMH